MTRHARLSLVLFTAALSGAQAQTKFSGATLVFDVVDNCDAGRVVPCPQRQRIDVFDSDYTHASEYISFGEFAASDMQQRSVITRAGDRSEIYGALQEYVFYPAKRPNTGTFPENVSGDCREFVTQQEEKTGATETVLGYRMVEYMIRPGPSETTAYMSYLPELGCVSFIHRLTHRASISTLVPKEIRATYDPEKLSLHPAGFADKPPSEVSYHALVKRLTIQGKSPAEIESIWQMQRRSLEEVDRMWARLRQ